MSDVSKRVAALSPEKRNLLLRRLQEREKGQARPAATLPLIEPDLERRHLPFPLSDVQQTYWIGQSGLFDLHSRGTKIYMAYDFSNISSRFLGVLLRRLETAVQRMIERHDLLRVVVLPDGRQQILPQVPPYRITVEDLRGQDERRVTAALAGVRERICGRSAPLDRWPLFEFMIQRLDRRRVRLHIGIDALLIDGTSRLMLLNELFQRLSTPERTFAPIPCSYRDYVLTWTAFQASELYQRARDYWLSRLPELPPAPELPLAQPIGPATPNEALTRSFQIEPETWQRLKARAAQAGLSPSGVATAAYVEIVAAWSGSTRFTISLVGTYRPPIHPQIHEILGNFNTIYLLEVDHTQETFEARARRIQEQITTDLEYRYFSGFEVLRELNRRRGGSSRAVMPVFFNSVIEYSHPSYQISPSTRSERTTPAAPADSHSSPLRRLRDQLGGLLTREALRLYQKIAPPPQVHEVEINLLGSQILLAPTVSENSAGAFGCLWQSVEHVFPAGLMEAMMNAYMQLLRRLADDEASWRQHKRLALPPEQLERWTTLNAATAPAADGLLHTLFAAQASERPDQPAVIAADRTLTYAELHRRMTELAMRLSQLGARPNGLVAVVLEPGWQQVVAVLAVLQSGAAFLPLDPHTPNEQLAHLLEQHTVKLVLTSAAVEARLAWPEHVRRLCLDQIEPPVTQESAAAPAQQPSDLACIYVASDTVHAPFVTLDHRGLLSTILEVNRRFGVGPADRILALSPLSFDLSLYDMFGPLLAGGALVIPDLAARDPARWAELMIREQVTLWNSPPSLLELLVTYLAGRPDQIPPALRLALLSRDWIPTTLPARLRSLLATVQLVSLGGATETALWSTTYMIPANEAAPAHFPPARPLANQRVAIMNDAMELCPVWVPGQLYSFGTATGGTETGRHGDRETRRHGDRETRRPGDTETGDAIQTQSSVLSPQSSSHPYRTGELARLLPDGQLEYLGRVGQSHATVHGYTVALREVEAALERHLALRSAVVVPRAAEHGPGQRLVAYVVQKSAVSSQQSEFGNRKRAAANHALNGNAPSSILHSAFSILHSAGLPEYMIPSAFVVLDALPLTANGLIDHAALAAFQPEVAGVPKAFVAPRDDWELQLARIWENLLDTRPIGVTDHFFDLGGDSLLAARMIVQVQQQFGQPFPLYRFFYEATIEHLARLLHSPAGSLAPADSSIEEDRR